MDRKRARPIRFIYQDDCGKLQIDPEALSVLQCVKQPIGVVSVFGRPHEGKSFLLNKLMHVNYMHHIRGFPVAESFPDSEIRQSCTKGIWLWSAPLRADDCDYLLLDVEGIDDHKMGKIDEAALDRLAFFVTEITKHVRIRASEDRSSAVELGEFFSPVFVWLLRDISQDFVVGNNCILTPRDYLENALIRAKNKIRESFVALFPCRECFSIVPPSNDEIVIRALNCLPLDYLGPDFRFGLCNLSEFINARTRPKKVQDTPMTGPILARITQSFLDALNKGEMLTLTSS